MSVDQTLNVTINSEAGAATADMGRVESLLVQIEADLAKMGATGAATLPALTDGHRAAAGAATSHAEAETILGATIGKTEVATNAAARAFAAFGFETGEATERVLGFTEALDAVGAAAGPLLLVGGALLGLGAGIEFLKDGVDEAAKFQAQMTSLGVAVKNQGAAWNETTQNGVERYLKAIEESTTFSQGEALEALNKLTTAGISLADAQKIVAISTDAAAAKHISLMDVVDRIMQAEAGRGRGLVQLDANLKDIIARHGTLQEVLDQLARDMQGQATAALDTYEGRWKQVTNTFEETSKELGTELLPLLMVGADLTLTFAKSFEDGSPKILGSINQWTEKMGEFIDTIAAYYEFAKKWIDLTGQVLNAPKNAIAWYQQKEADWTKMPQDQIEPTVSAKTGGVQGLKGGGFGDWNAPGSSMGDTIVNLGVGEIADKIKADIEHARKELDEFRNQPLGNNPIMGNAKAGSSTPIPDLPEDASQKAQAFTMVQKNLEDQLKATTQAEALLKAQIDAIADPQQKAAAQQEYANRVYADATHAISELSAQQIYFTNEKMRLTAEFNAEQQAVTRTAAAYDATKNALGSTNTPEETKHVEELRRAHEQAETALNATRASLNQLNSTIEQNSTLLEQNRVKQAQAKADELKAFEDLYRAFVASEEQKVKAHQESSDQMILDIGRWLAAHKGATQAMIDDWLAKVETVEKSDADTTVRLMTDRLNLKQISLSAAIEELQTDLAMYKAMGDAGQEAYQRIQQALVELEKKREEINQKALDDAQKFEQEQEKYATELATKFVDLMDSATTKGKNLWKSFGDEFKTVLGDMEKALATSVLASLFAGTLGLPSAGPTGTFSAILGKELGLPSAPQMTPDQQKAIAAATDTATNTAATAKNTDAMTVQLDTSGPIASGIGGVNQTNQNGFAQVIQLLQQLVTVTQQNATPSATNAQSPGGSLAALAAQYGITGVFTGAQAGSIIGSLDTTSMFSVLAGPGLSTSAGAAAGAAAGASAIGGSGGGGILGALGGIGGAGALLGALGGIGGAIGIGGTLDNFVGASGGSHGENSAIAGIATALGLGAWVMSAGLPFAAAFGPVGLGIVAAAALFGGLFGGGATPATSPDIFNTSQYGQWVANATGHEAGANGQSFYPSQSFLNQTGGQGGISFIEEQLAGAKMTSNGEYLMPDGSIMTPAQYNEYVSAFGISSTGSGKLNFGHNIGQEWISGAQGASSSPQSYLTLDQLMQSFMKAGGDGASLIFSIARTYPNFAGSTTAAGAYQETPTTISVGGYPVSSTAKTANGTTINVNITGPVVGPQGLASVAQHIAQVLRRYGAGEVPGSYQSNPQLRYQGN